MKVNLDGTKAESNGQFERQQFGIADMSIVINLLTKLYHLPKQTLTQEYISNARDANREAKSTRPIEVTAPSRFNPTMIVRDFGPGLSSERINSVFLFYGASTKRDSNGQTGGFGIGAKSAWAYVDSFNIITYIDGIKRTYIAHKSSGNGNLDMIAQDATNEPNGTAIQIAIKPQDVNDFRNAILRTTFFWEKEERPIYHGFTPSEVSFELKETVLSKQFSVYESLPNFLDQTHDYGSKSTFVVIDGIPYKVTSNDIVNVSEMQTLQNQVKVLRVFRVGNSVLHIAPNREDIVSDDYNKGVFKNLATKAIADVRLHVENELKRYTDVPKALAAFIELHKTFACTNEHKGYSIQYGQITMLASLGAHGQSPNVPTYKQYYLQRNRRAQNDSLKTSDTNSIHLNQLNAIYYDDCTNDSTAVKGYRLRKQLKAGKELYVISHTNQVIVDRIKAELGAKPLSSIDVSDYQVVRKVKASVQKKEFCAHWFDGGTLDPKQVKAEDFDKDTVYAFIDSDWYKKRESDARALIYYMARIKQSFFFVSKSNLEFLDSNPLLLSIEAWVKKHDPDIKDIEYTLAEKLQPVDYFRKLTPIADKLKDKQIKHIVSILAIKQKREIEVPKEFEYKVEKHPLFKAIKDVLADVKKFDKLVQTKYPLLPDFAEYSIKSKSLYQDHVISYINSNV